MEQQNKVIIIGNDHNNTLGLVRSFGKNGIAPYGIIISSIQRKGYVCRSKYWKRVWLAQDEKDAIRIMWEEFHKERKKPVVFTCSDKAAMLIDLQFDKLKNNFILSSIKETQGMIAELMDKKKLTKFAETNGIKTAKSWELHLCEKDVPNDLEYPCIFKPIVSAKGMKSDIEIAANKTEALELISCYKTKGYDKILIQKFIEYNCESVAIGACWSNNKCVIVMKKLRIWPRKKGSTSFGVKESDNEVLKVADKAVNALMKMGYLGLFDIDLFSTNDGVYLNEINFRNSGCSAIAMASGIHYAVDWYYQMIGYNRPQPDKKYKKEWFFMNEIFDFQYVRTKDMSYSCWRKDKKKVSAFALYDKADLLPYIFMQMERISAKIRGGGTISNPYNYSTLPVNRNLFAEVLYA